VKRFSWSNSMLRLAMWSRLPSWFMTGNWRVEIMSPTLWWVIFPSMWNQGSVHVLSCLWGAYKFKRKSIRWELTCSVLWSDVWYLNGMRAVASGAQSVTLNKTGVFPPFHMGLGLMALFQSWLTLLGWRRTTPLRFQIPIVWIHATNVTLRRAVLISGFTFLFEPPLVAVWLALT
jgi:hypothetical protein